MLTKKSELPTWRGYVPAIVLFLCTILQSVFYHQNFHIGMTTGMRIKTSLIAAIFKKSLNLHPIDRKSTTLGEIVNLMSVDCQRIQDTFTHLWSFMSCPVQLCLGILLLWDVIGPPCFAGLFVLLLLTLMCSIVVVVQKKLQEKILQYKGKRIKLMNETLQGIKVLKMYAWERLFKKKITEIRNKELHFLRLNAYLQSITTLIWRKTPYFNTLSTIAVLVLTSEEHFLDAKEAFTTVVVSNIVGSSVFSIGIAASHVAQTFVSIRRIEKFLTCQELEMGNVQRDTSTDYVVEIENGIFTWDLNLPLPTLRGINLKTNQGKLIAIVGQVACGKSSLISALLGEMEKLGGRVNIKGKVAYVPQEAWIQNDTVRNNILFGNEYLEKKFTETINACALATDLEMLPGGDSAEIGEKGINISGGQKQRLSLARAVYSNSDIYLMDDPLSAVDSHVGKHIFEKVIGPNGLLDSKTRILVTHGVHWLPMVDTVVVMVNGEISEIGSYEELVSNNGAFVEFLEQCLSQEDSTEIQTTKQKLTDHVKSDSFGNITSTDNKRQMMYTDRRERTVPRTYTSLDYIERESKNEFIEGERLTADELSPESEINWSAFGYYFKALGLWAIVIISIVFIGFGATNILTSFWLAYWTEDEYLKYNQNLSTTEEYMDRSYGYLAVYGSLGIIQCVLVFTFSLLMEIRMVVASKKLHHRMLESVMHAPMEFFDTTPAGRIMNRFSSDVDIIDGIMQMVFKVSYVTTIYVVSTLIVITINTPVLLTIILPVTVLYFFLMKLYIPSAWQLKRMESATRSPVYNHFSETVTGSSVIRAFGATDRFIKESMRRVDKHQSFHYANFSSARWVGIRVEFLGNILVLSTAMFSIFSDLDGATVGLSVIYALKMTEFLNLLVFNYSDLTNNIVCVDRIKNYSEIKAEIALYSETKRREDWPSTGNIQFIDYKTRYRKGLDLVLKGISCKINHGEMIGIVGRTGAGKSSLTLSLFRLIEAAGGSITIDGIKITDIGLHDLRSNITILPQDPVLFSGSLRMNLDPFDQYTDDEIWQALERAHLKEFVLLLPTQFGYECGDRGDNLSVGQRQLVCLARTLLKKTKILILDEATAAVDFQTDDLIQETIRTEFRDCTVLTIAHRLNTILDYNRVMVLDEGKIIEFDSPASLLQDMNSLFYGMARDAGLTYDKLSRHGDSAVTGERFLSFKL